MAGIECNHGKQASDKPTAAQLGNRITESSVCAANIENTLVKPHMQGPERPPRQRSVRFRLTCLVLACILPVCIIAFLFVYYSYQYKRALMDQRVLGITRALSTVVDRQLDLMRASATALATSRNLATSDLAAFYKQAQTVLQDYPDYDVVLSDASGQELLNTGVPFGKPLPIRADLDVVRTVFDTGRPATSNLYKDTRAGRYAFSVHVPVFEGNRVVYDLMFAAHAENFQKVISHQRIPPEWSACILDANKVLVARSRSPERFVGRQIFPAGAKAIDERVEGTVEAPGPEGVDVFATFSRSVTTGWTVAIAIPKALIWADSRRWLMWVIGGVILLSTMALALALFLAWRISGSIQALVAPALAYGRGEPVEIGQLDLSEANNVGQSLVKASQLLQERTRQREWAEGALRLSEEKFAKAFANNQAAVSITRLTDGVFLEVNDTFVELVGYSREEMIGHSSRRIMWPTRDACARCLRKLREKGSVRGWEQEFLKKSGEVFVTDLSANIWVLNGKKLVVTTLVDITARKRAEEALRDRESQFRAFFETEAVGAAEVDLNGRYVQVNQRYCQITGYSREELLGMSPVDLTHPEDRDADQPYFQAQVPILDIEKRYIRKDGSVIWVQVTAAMIRDCEGNVLRSAGVIQDITERKRAEEALLRAEKLAATGRMAATIAHEVNNPLAGAMNALYLASLDSGLKPKTKEYLTLADQELRRASHITQLTLGFYRTSGSGTATALPKLVDEVLNVYGMKLQDRNITVHRRYRSGRCAEGDDECFSVDGGEMRQILSNLLANGIDALKDNGMLYIRASRTSSLNEGGPNLQLTIADNGCGVRQEHLRRIFEPFFTTKQSFGTGLGLWVTQELVRQHNGIIKVRSREGKGTVFRITFPATPSDQQTNERNREQDDSTVQSFRRQSAV